MPTEKKLLMVIPVNTNRFTHAAKAYVTPVLAPDFTLHVVNLDSGFEAIQSRYSLQRNAEHVVSLVAELGPRYDGVFVSDFDGCGVEACREVLSIPVVDAFMPQASVALALAQTFSIITPNDTLIGLDIEHPRAAGLNECLASVRAMDLSVTQLDQHDLVIERAYEASVEAIEHDGAQAILLGCSAMMGVAAELSQRLAVTGNPVPVIDPNLASLAFLQMLVRCDLSQSAICYPTPPELRQQKAHHYASQVKPLARVRTGGPIGE